MANDNRGRGGGDAAASTPAGTLGYRGSRRLRAGGEAVLTSGGQGPVGPRLALAFVTVAVLAVALVALLAVIFTDRDIAALVQQRHHDLVRALAADAVSTYMTGPLGWRGEPADHPYRARWRIPPGPGPRQLTPRPAAARRPSQPRQVIRKCWLGAWTGPASQVAGVP